MFPLNNSVVSEKTLVILMLETYVNQNYDRLPGETHKTRTNCRVREDGKFSEGAVISL